MTKGVFLYGENTTQSLSAVFKLVKCKFICRYPMLIHDSKSNMQGKREDFQMRSYQNCGFACSLYGILDYLVILGIITYRPYYPGMVYLPTFTCFFFNGKCR